MSVQQLNPEKFRKELAGLTDPATRLPDMDLDVIRHEVINLCLISAELFSEDLDRKTLWERIGHGLETGVAKCGGDWEILVEDLLEYIKANPGEVAANAKMKNLMTDMALKPREWKDQFIRLCETKRMFILVEARDLWNSMKNKGGPQ